MYEPLLYQPLVFSPKHNAMATFVNGYEFLAQLCLLLLSSHDVVTGLELQLSRLFKRLFFFFFKEASPAGATCVL